GFRTDRRPGTAPPLADYSRDTNSPIFRAVTTPRRMPSPLRTIVAPGATSRTRETSRPTTTLVSPNTGDRTIVSRKDLATWMLVEPRTTSPAAVHRGKNPT